MKTGGLLAGILLLGSAQTGERSSASVFVSRHQLRSAVDASIASGSRGSDTPIRMIDTAGAHVGIGVVYRAEGASPSGSSSHDKVTEVYQIVAGAGTLVTGGEIVNPQRRNSAGELVGQVNGPGVSGTSIRNGHAQEVGPGDVIVIPAGTPHWFSQVDQPITCTVVRVDPAGVVALK